MGLGKWILTAAFAAAGLSLTGMEFKPFPDAVYQWGGKIEKDGGIDAKTGKPKKISGQYFLWIPEKCERVRGLAAANANVIESRFAADPAIRAVAAKHGFGILFTLQPVDAPLLDDMLREAAAKSGYPELTDVPLVPFGHSGNSKFCRTLVERIPEKIAAAVVVKGACPPTTPARIPVLFCQGEYEEVTARGKVAPRYYYYDNVRQGISNSRKSDPETPVGGFLDSGHTHMDYCPAMSEILALFLDRAITLRVGENGKLRPVDFPQGWMIGPDGKNPPVRASKFRGDRSTASWFFDRELAELARRSILRNAGKKDQLLGFVENGKFAPFWPNWGMQDLTFAPEADGCTFRVRAQFRDTIPSPWVPEGARIGHGDPAGIRYLVSGWANNTRQVGPDRFEVALDREGFGGRGRHVVIAAYHPGDAVYRETYVTAHFNKPGYGGPQGQSITFEKIADTPNGTRSIPLRAKSSAGTRVRYFVEYGPARVENDSELVLSALPPRTVFPVEVKVVAYHLGDARYRETRREQTFRIVRAPQSRP